MEAVLAGLDLPEGQRRIEVLNKIDLLDPAARSMVLERARRGEDAVAVSARTGEGCDALLALLGRIMAVRHGLHRFRLDLANVITSYSIHYTKLYERDDRGADRHFAGHRAAPPRNNFV